jgi:hypothetical protein
MSRRARRGVPCKPRDREEYGTNRSRLTRLQDQLQREWKRSKDDGNPSPNDRPTAAERGARQR